MCKHLCLHACVHVLAFLCVCMSDALCMRMSAGISVCVCTYVPVFICIYVCMRVVWVYVFVCVYTCECMCEYAYVCVSLSITRCRNAVLNAGEWRPHSWKAKFRLPQEALEELMVATVLPMGNAREAVFSDSAVTLSASETISMGRVWDGDEGDACGKGTPWTRRGDTGRA